MLLDSPSTLQDSTQTACYNRSLDPPKLLERGVCSHLSALERALRQGGYEDLAETSEGWGLDAPLWVYIHCCFELPRVAERFEFPPFVEIYRERDAHWGSWLGYECQRCSSASGGRHPSVSQNAPNFPGTGESRHINTSTLFRRPHFRDLRPSPRSAAPIPAPRRPSLQTSTRRSKSSRPRRGWRKIERDSPGVAGSA